MAGKSRICVSQPGGERELFSVLDRKQEGLVIVIPPTPFRELDGSSHEPSERRYSIHPSRKAQGTSIKQTVTLKSGTVIETQTFVNHTERDLLKLTLLCTPGLFNPKYAPKRKNDTIFIVGDYDPRITTMTYCLFVSNRGQNPHPPPYPFEVHFFEFEIFDLWLYLTYYPVPAPQDDLQTHFMTSTPRVNKGPTQYLNPDCPSDKTEMVPELVPKGALALRGFHLHSLAEALRRACELKPQLGNWETHAKRYEVLAHFFGLKEPPKPRS